MRNNLKYTILAIFMFTVSFLYGQSVVNTVHNLSVSGTETIKATTESEICIFCHTPHNSQPQSPLWNKQLGGITYDPLYGSSTLQASPGQPDGASMLCLSCHDGTIALGEVLSATALIDFEGGITTMPLGSSNLGQVLSDDHPISFVYNASLASADGELIDPIMLTGAVQLNGEKLQCTSCHDPHVNMLGNFLVASSQYSDLCLYCHQKNGWESSSHALSPATWNGPPEDPYPWQSAPYSTVAENGCENCHKPHSAGGHERLTNYLPEEDNCLNCHNSNVANLNVASDFLKSNRHNVYGYLGDHDPEELIIPTNIHVECVDCHNPHYANDTAPPEPSAPLAKGVIQGVPGINLDGNNVETILYEYELCFRCHTTSTDKPGSPTTRQIAQDNVRLEFALDGPSFHPVAGQGQNTNVPSLIDPYTESSIIYCSDCHASDNSSAAGPHGSIYPHILKYNYETADYTTESYFAYELCYQCHDRDAIINNETNEYGTDVHRKHIVDAQTPCNVCHDPHGISSSQGNSTNNSNLINFDISIVSPSSGMSARLEFNDTNPAGFEGNCYLFCHLRNHAPRSYN